MIFDDRLNKENNCNYRMSRQYQYKTKCQVSPHHLTETTRSSYTVIRKETTVEDWVASWTMKTSLSHMKCCSYCKQKSNNLKQCANCVGIFYCSRECQVNDWKEHKVECTEIFFADMFSKSDLVQSENCDHSLFKNVGIIQIHPTDIRVLSSKAINYNRLRETYAKTLEQGCKLVYLLKNYYQDGHNPCLKKDSPYVYPTGQHYIRPMYPGEIFGVILYNTSGKANGRALPHMCYVDYDAISSFLTYFNLELARFRELLGELNSKLPTEEEYIQFDDATHERLSDMYQTIERLLSVSKRSSQFVLHCLQRDLRGVHTYKVVKSKQWNLKDPSIVEDFKVPVSIAIQETPSELIKKLKLDPKHLPYHILIRSKTQIITVDKLPSFNDDFLNYITENLTSKE